MSNWNGTSDNSQHKGNWHIKNGVELSPEEMMSIIDSVAHAATIKAAMSKSGGPSFDDIKGYIKVATFAASAAKRNVEWVNEQVRGTSKPHSSPHARQQQAASGLGDSDRDEWDFS